MNKNVRKHHLETYGASLSALLNACDIEFKIGFSLEDSLTIGENIYICPLCLKSFFYFKNCQFYENEEFTEDHFPPQSVGGSRTILTCKPCNSSYGGNMDYALKEYLEFKRFLSKKEKASYPTKVSYSGTQGKYNLRLYWENGILIKEIDFKKYPLIQKWLLAPNANRNLTFETLAPSEVVIQKALLRAAYLHCFSNWGYDFIYSETAKRMRRVLEGKEEHPLSNFGVLADISFSNLANGFYFNGSSKDKEVFLLFFDIQLKKPEYKLGICVIIPGNDQEAWARMATLKNWIENMEADISLIRLWEDYIRRKNYFSYSSIWESLSSYYHNEKI
jgi:hypothetical protein